MEKLAEILHELIDAAHGLVDNRRGELHALVDEATAAPAAPAKPAAPPAPPAAPPVPDGAAQS